MTAFEHTTQFYQGKAVEEFLDEFFSRRGWRIEQTTPHEERVLCLGDRHFRSGLQHLHIEYKSGIQTYFTGNVFLETVSVDSANKPGWVFTCQADYLMYATLLNGCILVYRPDDLRAQMDGLKARFPERPTSKGQNKGYNTHGLLVPLADAKRFAVKVLQIGGAS